MATETEASSIAVAATLLRTLVSADSTPGERAATRHAIVSTCRMITQMVNDLGEDADVNQFASTAAGCAAFLAELVPFLADQIDGLEQRVAALEEER